MISLRILVADDHDLIRRGIKSLLEQSGWEVCGEARTGKEAVTMAEQLQPGIAILDITMPELNGLDVTRRIRKVSPQTAVLLVSVHYSDRLIHDSIEAGALGYLLKSDSDQELVKAVTTLAAGKPFYTGHATDAILVQANAQAATKSRGLRLTTREREILQLISEGKATKEVAAVLGLSVKTAETHRVNLMRSSRFTALESSSATRFAIG